MNGFATGRGMLGDRRARLREALLTRWTLGALGLVLIGAGVLGAITASPPGAAGTTETEAAAQAVAVTAANRLSAWIGEVGLELDDYAAAIVGGPVQGPEQLANSFQTFLTASGDFSGLEMTNFSGGVVAASMGAGVSVAGDPWLAGLSATPMVTPIVLRDGSLQWLVARLATAGGTSGILVGELQVSQVANLLSPVDAGAAGGPTIQAVLTGGVLLYSSTMSSTLHAGLTDAALISQGALTRRLSSPAVTGALRGGNGAASYAAHGVSTLAGYDSVTLPGWSIGIVASEPGGVAAAGAWPLGSPWLLWSLAILAGLLCLLAIALPRRWAAALQGSDRVVANLLGIRIAGRQPPSGTGGAPGGLDRLERPAGSDTETAVSRRRPLIARPRRRGERRLRGRYEVIEVIGKGGEGEVLRAFDHLHERQVAIKVRCLDPADQAGRREILNEAGVLLGMAPDPHTSVLREDFILGDRYYLVMDWIDGTPLDRLLVERGAPGLAAGDVLDWMGQVAEVLDRLHDQEPPVVHGDVKPSNVILSSQPGGRAILVDFGISQRRTRNADAGAAVERGVVGSPGYLAPEVLAGNPMTPAADIFGLAATTFALLAGHPPRLGEPPDWTELAHAAARRVEVAFRAALAVDPERRPGSARAFVASLRGAVVGAETGRRRAIPASPPAGGTSSDAAGGPALTPTGRSRPG